MDVNDESTQNTFTTLLTTSVFPWSMLSNRVSKAINETALRAGNLIQAMMLLIWIPYNTYLRLFMVINMPKFYSRVYLETVENCSRYYLLNSTTFEHYIVDLKENGTLDKGNGNDKCLYLPVFVCGLLAVVLTNWVIGVGWACTIDRRYGFLKIAHEGLVISLRTKHIIIQLPIILILLPVNIIAAIVIWNAIVTMNRYSVEVVDVINQMKNVQVMNNP